MTFTSAAKALFAVCAVVALAACSSTPWTEQHVSARSADEILIEIDATTFPAFDGARRQDQEYVDAYIADRNAVANKRSELVLELYNAAPDHERVPQLIVERWRPQSNDPEALAEIQSEIATMIKRHPADTVLGREARFAKASTAMSAIWGPGGNPDEALAAIEAFVADVPDDDRAATLLFQVAAYGFEGGSEQQIRLFERVRHTYGESEDPGAVRSVRSAEGQLRQLAAIGDRFEYAFTCAVTGSEVDTDVLTGKVVVVDFWATWCGPCVAKMPEMKELYAKYRDQGVEFIGISLDQPKEQGGLDSLLAFVDKNDLQWPQWYLGQGWASEFSTNWGISGIPTLFIVDAQGRLRSTTARGKLEELITELIAERDASVHQRVW